MLDNSGDLQHHIFLLPICYNEHWRLFTLDFKNYEIKFYDSYFDSSPKFQKIATDFANELIKKCKNLNDSPKWRTPIDIQFKKWKDSNKQPKGSNESGIFLLMFARQLILSKSFDFTLLSTHDFRSKMVAEILNHNIDTNYLFNHD